MLESLLVIASSSASSSSRLRPAQPLESPATTLSPLRKPTSSSKPVSTEQQLSSVQQGLSPLPKPLSLNPTPSAVSTVSTLSPLSKPSLLGQENNRQSANLPLFEAPTPAPCTKCESAEKERKRTQEEVLSKQQQLDNVSQQLSMVEESLAAAQRMIAEQQALAQQLRRQVEEEKESASAALLQAEKAFEQRMVYKDKHTATLNQQVEALSIQHHQAMVRSSLPFALYCSEAHSSLAGSASRS